jgi:Rieske Fe-S protein
MNPPPENRRSFLKWATQALGAIVAAVLGIPAVAYLLDARNRPTRSSDFRTVARLGELPEGQPKQFVITDTRRDAWTLHPNEEVGRVWLIKQKDGSVAAFTSICPHLGCSINFEEKSALFICPCHNGTFNLDGSLKQRPGINNPAPRGMDSLEVKIVEDAANKDNSLVQVKYQNFRQGLHDKIAKG